MTVVKHYAAKDSRIKYFAHDVSHGGPFAGRNTAIKHAVGEYLVFLDQDDLLISESLEKMAALIAASKSDVVRGLRISLKRGQEKIMNNFRPDSPLMNVAFAQTREVWAGQHFASWVFKREFVAENQFEFEPFIGHDDKVFLLCALAWAKDITISSIPLVKYRRHSASLQGRRNMREMFNDMQAHDHMMQCLHKIGYHEVLEYRFCRWDFPTIAGACAWIATWGGESDREKFYAKARSILNRAEVRKLELEEGEQRAILHHILESEEPVVTRFLRRYSHRLKEYPAWRVLWNRGVAAYRRQFQPN